MSEINTPDAISIIARHFIHRAIEREIFDGAWGLYPELSQTDWESVEERVKSMLGESPTTEQFRVAYEHLERRTERWAKEHPDAV